MNKFLVIGILVTLFGILLDGLTVRNYGDKRNLLSFFIMAVGSSIIVQVVSPHMISLHSKLLGGFLLIVGLIIRFGNVRILKVDYQSVYGSDDSQPLRWMKSSSRGLIFSIIITGVMFLADIANLIPKNP